MTDPNSWSETGLAILIGLGLVAVVAVPVLILRWAGGWILRRNESLFLTVAPQRFGAIAVGIVRFYKTAALLCGLTAFAISLLIFGDRWPAGLSDPALRNPLLWLTWLAVMTGIMAVGIVGGVLARYALETTAARLRRPPTQGR